MDTGVFMTYVGPTYMSIISDVRENGGRITGEQLQQKQAQFLSRGLEPAWAGSRPQEYQFFINNAAPAGMLDNDPTTISTAEMMVWESVLAKPAFPTIQRPSTYIRTVVEKAFFNVLGRSLDVNASGSEYFKRLTDANDVVLALQTIAESTEAKSKNISNDDMAGKLYNAMFGKQLPPDVLPQYGNIYAQLGAKGFVQAFSNTLEFSVQALDKKLPTAMESPEEIRSSRNNMFQSLLGRPLTDEAALEHWGNKRNKAEAFLDILASPEAQANPDNLDLRKLLNKASQLFLGRDFTDNDLEYYSRRGALFGAKQLVNGQPTEAGNFFFLSKDRKTIKSYSSYSQEVAGQANSVIDPTGSLPVRPYVSVETVTLDNVINLMFRESYMQKKYYADRVFPQQ
jgi:hypothetical protein